MWGESSNAPSPQKKTHTGPSKTLAPALPPSLPWKNGRDKFRDKSPKVSIQSGDRTSPTPPRDQRDHLTSYQKDYVRSMRPKIVKGIDSMSLGELGGSVQRVAFKFATLVSCYKNRFVRHKRKQHAELQDLKKKAESANRSKEKMLARHRQVMDLEEKVAIL